MYSCVLIIVTGIIQVLGRPTDDKIDSNGNSLQIPPWPLEKNMFLFPTTLNSNDIINITITTKRVTEEISINFVGVDDKKTNGVICSIKTDRKSQIVTIFNERDEPVVEEQIDHFFLDDDKTLFNMWLKRRVNDETDENNVLEVYTKSSALKPFIVDNINEIRYLKFSGDEAKMLSLEFKFA